MLDSETRETVQVEGQKRRRELGVVFALAFIFLVFDGH